MRSLAIIQIFGSAMLGNAQSVVLGSASTFGASGPAGVTNTGPTTVDGDVGTSGTSVTGFPPGILTGTLHVGDDLAAQAEADAGAAFVQGQNLAPTVDEAGLAELGGLTLVPGVYKFDTGVGIDGTLILSGAGDYVFQLASTLATASLSEILLTNGASACNVFWIVGTGATLGTYSVFAGNILAGTAITVTTGVTVSGGLYAGSAVTLDTDIIGSCGGSSTPSSSSSTASSTTVATPTSSSTVVTPTSSTSIVSPTSSTTIATSSTTSSSSLPSSTSGTSTATSSTTVKTSKSKTTSTTTAKTTSTTTKSTYTTTAKTSTTTSKDTYSTKTTSSTSKDAYTTSTTAKTSTTLKTSTTSYKTTTSSTKIPSATATPCPDPKTDSVGYILCHLSG